MVREIIQPHENAYTIQLPDELMGKTVEIIAFAIEEQNTKAVINEIDLEKRLKSIRERYSTFPSISHANYSFDRDEANDNRG
jgi:hypothetical protein